MTRYISNPDNLKLMMNMLKEKSRNIQFEAFHVFKVGQEKITLTSEGQLTTVGHLTIEGHLKTRIKIQ